MNDFLIALIDKILWGGFAFSAIALLYYMGKFVYYFLRNPPKQMTLVKSERIALGVFVAYIIMCIFTGIKL